jgi:hypothetical protein
LICKPLKPVVYLPQGLTFNKRQLTYKRNTKARSHTHFCFREAVDITHSECVSAALVIQHATRMRHIVLSCVGCLAIPYLCTLSHSTVRFEKKKVIQHKTVFWFSLQRLSETFVILRRTDLLRNVNQQNALIKLMF